jgi:hypothetical protein
MTQMNADQKKEHPILFSGEMVRAILDGRKTQTRRVVKPPLQNSDYPNPKLDSGEFCVCPDLLPTSDKRELVIVHCESRGIYRHMGSKVFAEEFCPYGVPGDRLWVRETWSRVENGHWCPIGGDPVYKADGGSYSGSGFRWISSIHMPRWASRITLEITGVRVERLQGISEEDCIAEGCDGSSAGFGEAVSKTLSHAWFFQLWDSINDKKHPWASNPWVWVIEFRKVT